MPERHTDYVRDTITRVDTIYRDRTHTERRLGDTIFIHDSIILTDIHYRDREVARIIHDSVPSRVLPAEQQDSDRPGRFYRNCTIGFWLLLLALLAYIIIRIYLRR